jgi:hypothetical protein
MTRTAAISRTLLPLMVMLVVALASAGCGPAPPQAPLAQAKKLDAATSHIATACGLTYQVTAFPGDRRADLANLEAAATSSADELASVYARNPSWIYQGETVSEIVHDGIVMLRTCGLRAAAGTLTTATSGRDAGTVR